MLHEVDVERADNILLTQHRSTKVILFNQRAFAGGEPALHALSNGRFTRPGVATKNGKGLLSILLTRLRPNSSAGYSLNATVNGGQLLESVGPDWTSCTYAPPVKALHSDASIAIGPLPR